MPTTCRAGVARYRMMIALTSGRRRCVTLCNKRFDKGTVRKCSFDNSHSRQRIVRSVTRRTVLGAAAAVAAAPALAEECHIGPPAHAQGPSVWMNLDQVELDAAYDQSFYAPLGSQILARLASNSELTRRRLGPPQREAYGPTEIEMLDIFRTKRPKAPIFLFIHGGAWLHGRAKEYAFAAETFVNAGAHYVVPGFYFR